MPIRRNYMDLLYNSVDEDFQKLLKPLNIIQSIYFYPKYRIRNNIITSNGLTTKLLSSFVTVGYLIMAFYHVLVTITGDTPIIGIKEVIQITDYFTLANIIFGFGTNLLSCVLCSNNNVGLVLKLQEAYKMLVCSKSKLKTLIISNWISIIAIIVIDVLICISFLYIFKTLSVFNMFSYIIYMCFDFNIVYAICMAHLLRSTIVLWNLRVRDKDEFCWKTMFNAYRSILEAYALYEKVFQSYILYHLIETFILSLVYLQMFLDVSKTVMEQHHDITLATLMLVLTWFVKSMCLHIILNIELEKFYSSINETQSYTLLLRPLNNLCDPERQARKNLQRLYKVVFSKMKVYCLFTMDATLPLRLSYTIVTYMIVLLQIALQPNKDEVTPSWHNDSAKAIQ